MHYGGSARPTFFASLRRGLSRRCPSCGRGALLRGYLKAHEACGTCGLPFEPLRSDDAAPYFTILIVGHVVVPLILLVEQHVSPPVSVQLAIRSEEHTSELQSLMRISYAVFCLKKKNK